MAIRHLKHRYLIKKQFLEEKWLITSDFFSFSRVSDFSFLWWGFLLFGFIEISQMHDGKIIILFPFFFLKLGTLIVGDVDLAFCNNVNCLDRFFWIRDGLCGVPVKGQSFNQVWTVLGLFGLKGFRLPQWREVLVKGKGFSQIWIILKLLAQSG